MSDTVDFALGKHWKAWLRHPVLGDPSFDSWVRGAGNPIYRGAAPREWPVNGFLFHDPRGGGLFAYVGRYARGYGLVAGAAAWDCVVLRSRDDGKTWEEVGPVFSGRFRFEGDGADVKHAPDVSVAFHGGRYHLVYDWVHEEATWETLTRAGRTGGSGVGYAWAERPEGPFVRAAAALWRNGAAVPPMADKYGRLYASTLLRRERDWLLLLLSDSGPRFAWGLQAMTAREPEGPWSEPALVLSLEGDRFHPGLMEFFPAFSQGGQVWAPATSVALNRNYQCLWCAPIEEAHVAGAWELAQAGSLWHAEAVPAERAGIWGQTFSVAVRGDGRARLLFPSRDEHDCGTINLAEGAWPPVRRERGFVLGGNAGPSVTALRQAHGEFRLQIEFALQGTARLLWRWRPMLGPDRPAADATLHPRATAECVAWEIGSEAWRLLRVAGDGTESVVATGAWRCGGASRLEIVAGADGGVELRREAATLWQGAIAPGAGQIGLWVAPGSRLEVTKLAVTGRTQAAVTRWHWRDAFLATGVRAEEWSVAADADSPCGETARCRAEGGRLKWNFTGTGIRWWAPRGPDLGRVRLKIDGTAVAEVELGAAQPEPAACRFACAGLADGDHALVIEAIAGRLATAGAEVAGPAGFGVDNPETAGTIAHA